MIINKDCLEALKELPDNSIDSIVTDPPYGLSFMGKKWDYDVPSTEIWQECLRVLKPGGYLLAFAGTRTQHRMAVRIEDAGFEIRDMIAWLYGSGFPKSLNIGKAVDKLQGNEREVVDNPYKGRRPNGNAWVEQLSTKPDEYTKGTSEWEGWGTALKPAVEPVSVCSKPLQVEHIFVILIDDIWKQLNVLGVTNNLQDTQVKLNEVVNSVHENARTSVLESTNNAELVKQVIMSLQTKSEEEKENSVLENVAQNGEKLYQEIKTQLGEEVEANLMDISISAQMGDISENTALLWKNISEEILNQANKLTTRTALKLITDLKTLRLFLLQNTFSNTGLSKKIQPNLEPITVARKPIEGTVAENCLKWGVGGINIDECRVESKPRLTGTLKNGEEIKAQPTSFKGSGTRNLQTSYDEKMAESNLGRFPANLIHDGSDEVLGLFPETKTNGVKTPFVGDPSSKINIGGGNVKPYETNSGSAARFFYCAKASKSERNRGLDGTLTVKYTGTIWKEENIVAAQLLKRVISDMAQMSFSTGESGESLMVQFPKDSSFITETIINKIMISQILNSLMHSLTNEYTQDANLEVELGGNLVENVGNLKAWILTITKDNLGLALGANHVALEMLSQISKKENWKEATNFHSTVKPIKLMEYLVNLVSKEGHTVLDPFCGSGTTGIACKKLNRNFIGIERDEEYCKIAEARIESVSQNNTLFV